MEAETAGSTKTTTSFTLKNMTYLSCSVSGLEASFLVNGCEYQVTAEGAVSILCPEGKTMEIKVSGTSCVFKIGAQSHLTTVKYHNIGSTAANTTEITVEPFLKNIKGTVSSGCPLMKEGAFTEGEYTTGNTLLTGSAFVVGTMTSAWWA